MRKLALAAALVCLAAVGCAGYFIQARQPSGAQTSDPTVQFVMDAYDQIDQNYWMKPGSYQQYGIPELPQLFAMAAKQVSGRDAAVATSTHAGVENMLETAFAAATSSAEKKEWALQIVSLVTNSLLPQGRNEVLTAEAETQLRDTVSNINTATNLYSELGVTASATPMQITAAYKQETANLAAHPSATSSQAIARIGYVHDVLSNAAARVRYDTTGAEPTVFSHVFGTTLYLAIDKIAPTTLQEFAVAIDNASTTPLTSLLIDLRGNIGGSLDLAPSLIGVFVGQNAYTFDLFHQGDFEVQRSPVPVFGDLSRFKDIAVLTDNMTQSTAEVWTAALKRFHLATVVGATTRGWGTVENTYSLAPEISSSTKYALLLVNSLTVSDSGQPIQGNGVAPDISITDKNWKTQLTQRIRSQSLISAIEKTIAGTPIK